MREITRNTDRKVRCAIALLAFLFSFFNVFANGYIVSAIYSEENNQLPSAATCVCTDSVGYVWVGTQDGLVRYDGYEFRQYKAEPLNYSTAISNHIIDIKPLSNNRLALLVLGGQTFVFSAKDGTFHLYPNPQKNVGDDYIYIERIETANDSLYMLSDEGRSLILGQDTIAYYRNIDSTYLANFQMIDNNDSFETQWSIENGALVKLKLLGEEFSLERLTKENSHHSCRKKDDIQSILSLGNGDLVFSNASNSLVFKKNCELKYLNKNGILQNEPCDFYNVKTIKSDGKGGLWLGGKGRLIHLSPQKDAFSINIYPTPKNTVVSDILIDSKGNVWVGTSNDGLYLLKNDGTFMTMHKEWKDNYPPRFVAINCLHEDSKGIIWMGSTDGVTLFDSNQDDYSNIRFFFYNSETTDLIYSHITDITEDTNGELWFTSIGGGLYHCSSDRFLGEPLELESFETKQTKVFLSVVSLDSSSLALLSPNSILKVNTNTKECEEYAIDMIKGISFRDKSIAKGENGLIYIPSSVGCLSIDYNNLSNHKSSPKYVISGLVSNNNELDFSADKIVLERKNNSFTIRFSDLLYSSTNYKYRLIGLDKKYTNTILPLATFTNVPHGEYTFELASENSDLTMKVNVTVLPAWYETVVAKVIFAIILLALLYFAVRAYLNYYKKQTQKDMESHLNQMKLNFFTDISHEIRTPLTLISAPIESLENATNFGDEEKRLLGVVKANAERMKSMVNELLDYSRLDSDHFENNIVSQSIKPILKRVSQLFLQEAEKKSIDFIIEDNTNDEECDIDSRQIETAIINLLSNAFKFTPKHGTIRLSANFVEDRTIISVYDNGKEIEGKDKLLVFKRFFTTGDRENSSGIGLSIVKRIMENLNGTVELNTDEGRGVEIKLVLPRYLTEGNMHASSNNKSIANNKKSFDNSPTILILEDNRDLREFLIQSLGNTYNVLSGENGRVGLSVLETNMPDLILSDIIMPEMDGVAFAQAVKSNPNISHLPIVLLTAKDDMQTKLQSLNIGITDYITKPFSMEYLSARIANILKEREELKAKYRGIVVMDDPAEEIEEDKAIVEARKLTEKILAVISNEDLNVDYLCSLLKLSRLAFTSKCKTLFGLTPVELVRDLRMKKAKELLKTTDMNIQEISYAVGISDQRYFARCFKQMYGMTASEMREKEK